MKPTTNGTNVFFEYDGLVRPKYSGIYMILNTVTNKRWIGQAVNIYRRWAQHLGKFKRGNNSPKLQASWDKHGCSVFDFSVVCKVEIGDLVAKEAYYMDFYKSNDDRFGYNLEKIDRRGLRVVSEETKQKTSATMKGKIGVGRPVGIPMDAHTKKTLSDMLIGRPKPNGWCKGKSNPNYGKRGAETSRFGAVWYKNPDTKTNLLVYPGELPPEGYVKGRKIKWACRS